MIQYNVISPEIIYMQLTVDGLGRVYLYIYALIVKKLSTVNLRGQNWGVEVTGDRGGNYAIVFF